MHALNEHVEDFIFHCQYEKNLSFNSIRAFRIDLEQSAGFISSESDYNHISQIDKYCIKKYINSITGRNKPKTVKRKISTLKAFFSHLEFEDIITINPFHKIHINIREGKQLPRTIDRKIISKLFKYLYSLKYNFRQRDQYIFFAIVRDIEVIELFFSTGLRVFELCNLKKENVNLKEGSVKIVAKGNKERIIPICSSEKVQALKEYFYIFKNIIKIKGYFFINRLDQRLSEQSVRLMIRKHLREIKIEENITPHMFRHSIATMLLENEVDIRYIQDFLGHSSINTTQIYAMVTREASRGILSKKHSRQHMNFSR